MYPAIIKVEHIKDYTLKLEFDNGNTKLFDFSKYLEKGRFRELKDINLFKKVKVSFDSIEFANGLDFDPEVLYDDGVLED